MASFVAGDTPTRAPDPPASAPRPSQTLSLYSSSFSLLLRPYTLLKDDSLDSQSGGDKASLQDGRIKCSSSAIGLFGDAGVCHYSSDEDEGAAALRESDGESDSASSDGDDAETGATSAFSSPTPKAATSTTTTTTTTAAVTAAKGNVSSSSSSSNNTIEITSAKVPSILIPLLDENAGRCVVIPSAILPSQKQDAAPWTSIHLSHSFHSISANLQSFPAASPSVLVVLLRSGRFAAALFSRDVATHHRACTRYTVRKGQGGSQSSNDSSKGKAKSMGSQLRRAGEVSLREDVRKTLVSDWGPAVRGCAALFLAVPNVMKKGFFEESVAGLIARDDLRIRRVPVAVLRPTFEACKDVYALLTTVAVRDVTAEEQRIISGEVSPAATAADGEQQQGDGFLQQQQQQKKKQQQQQQQQEALSHVEEAPPPPPFTPLHDAAKNGDIDALTALLENASFIVSELNCLAGPKYETPLHLASKGWNEHVPKDAPACVLLLLRFGADPTVMDSHGRVPYSVSGNDKVREAYRLGRGEIGEEDVNWAKAYVPAPLDDEKIKEKKAKEKEKKKRQLERKKAEKVEEDKEAAAEAAKKKEEEDAAKAEEEAKRMRAGLSAKKSETACDFCGVECRRRSQMFNRLDWYYCKTECVKNHQRELQAQAAMARMGGGVLGGGGGGGGGAAKNK